MLVVNVLVLGVPVLAFAGLKIYDTQLVRRTEAEVIAQAAHIKADFERELAQLIEESTTVELGDDFGRPGQIHWPQDFYELHPISPVLDSSRTEIHPPEAEPEPPRGQAEPLMAAVGRRLEPALIDAQKITLSGMSVVDWRGNTVATTNSSQRNMSLHNREEIQRSLDGEVVHMLRQRETIPEHTSLESLSRETSSRVFFAMPITYEDRIVGAVMVWRTPMSLPQALYKNRGIFGLLLGLILLGGLTITGLTAFYIGRPIERLIDQTEHIADNDQRGLAPINTPGTFEIQQLSESIADMAVALEVRADYIRTFARSVSHEFKTPLTSIRGTVELLEDHLDSMSDEERAQFLEIIDSDARRLQNLVGRLLELAKADVGRDGDAHSNATAIINEVVALYGDELDITLKLPSQPVEVAVAEEALRSALNNLLINAAEHGGPNVTITLLTEADDDGPHQAHLRIHDDGPGISQGNVGKIFDEFFTTARDRGGTGLGLSITRALVESYGSQLRHVPCDQGACFEISMPLHIAEELRS